MKTDRLLFGIIMTAAAVSCGLADTDAEGYLKPFAQKTLIGEISRDWHRTYGDSSVVELRKLIRDSASETATGEWDLDMDILGRLNVRGHVSLDKCRKILSMITVDMTGDDVGELIEKADSLIDIGLYFPSYSEARQSSITLVKAEFHDSSGPYYTWESALRFEESDQFTPVSIMFEEWGSRNITLPF